jgi:hypothetical protein
MGYRDGLNVLTKKKTFLLCRESKCGAYAVQPQPITTHTVPVFYYTRWFKYDRDYLCINKSQFVPVIFEPPCTSQRMTTESAYEWTVGFHQLFCVKGTFKSIKALYSYEDCNVSEETAVCTVRVNSNRIRDVIT